MSQFSESEWHEVWLEHLNSEYAGLLREQERFDEAEQLLGSTAVELERLLEQPLIYGIDYRRGHTQQLLAHAYMIWAGVEKSRGNESRRQELLDKVEKISSWK